MDIAITEKITQDQTAQLANFVNNLIRKLDLSKDEAQKLIKDFNLAKPDLEKVFRKHAILDQRFGAALTEFVLTVPADYKHDKQLDTFAKANKKKFYSYNSDITDKNFSKATTKLDSGKKYKVKIFPILETVTSEDCMSFLKSQRAILVGGQGESLVWDSNRDQLPVGKWTVSFDEKDALWIDSVGYHRVPFVFRNSDGDFFFNLGCFECEWYADYCLLCFCDEESLDA
jgi:hypothetical protein